MHILATYTGRSRNGFVQGSTYKLAIHGSMIRRINGSVGNAGETTYGSLRNFLAEWSSIMVLSDDE